MLLDTFVYHVHTGGSYLVSSWIVMPRQQVLRNHGDFRDGQNPPSNLTIPTAPVFTLVKRRSQRTVLVLDVSGSMGDNDRIGRLAQVSCGVMYRVNIPTLLLLLKTFRKVLVCQLSRTRIR